jgi:mono/diheme cytochrome c family protein
MNLPLKVKTLGWALLAASLSVGGAWLLASPIKMITGSSPGQTTLPCLTPSSQIVTTPEVVNQGREFYRVSCSHCHGDDASGDEDGPDLHYLPVSNARIAKAIKTGIKGQMPKYAKKYDDQQIAAIVSYLRSLR